MTRRPSPPDQRLEKILALLTAHAADFAAVPAVAEAVAELRRRVQPASAATSTAAPLLDDDTIRETLEVPLIAQLVKAATALDLFYQKTKRPEYAAVLLLRRGEYGLMTYSALVVEARNVADQISKFGPQLVAHGYKPAHAATLAAQVQTYAVSRQPAEPVPLVADDVATYLDGPFRAAMALLVNSHPKLHKLLRQALGNDESPRKGKGLEHLLPMAA